MPLTKAVNVVLVLNLVLRVVVVLLVRLVEHADSTSEIGHERLV